MLIFNLKKLQSPKVKRHRLHLAEKKSNFHFQSFSLEKIKLQGDDPELEKKLEEIIKKDQLEIEFEGSANFYQRQKIQDFALMAICSRVLDQEFILLENDQKEGLYYSNGIFATAIYL